MHQNPRTPEAIQQDITRMASRSWWIGAGVGVILGFLAGLALGYLVNSDTVHVVPLRQGIKT